MLVLLKSAVGATAAADASGLLCSYSRNNVDFVVVVAFAVVAGADLLDGVLESAEEDATPWPLALSLGGEEVVAVS